jgi:hypothetical protein
MKAEHEAAFLGGQQARSTRQSGSMKLQPWAPEGIIIENRWTIGTSSERSSASLSKQLSVVFILFFYLIELFDILVRVNKTS